MQLEQIPSIEDARQAAVAIASFINKTPVHQWQGSKLAERIGQNTQVTLKLELFQRAGSFKTRGALLGILALDEAARARGVTAVSAGNHAIAVSYAAQALGVDAKVVMQSSANPARVAAAKAYGAEVIIGGDGPACFALAEKIVAEEGRTFIHPFEGHNVTLGTATLGIEICEQAGPLDALIIPVGGGGLASGVALMTKQLMPDCKVYGVEPAGADSMSRSFAAGEPQRLEKVETIADSLGPPMALPYSFGLCRANIDQLLTVTDDAIRSAMLLLFDEMKLAVEPAAAAGTAALLGPLCDELAGKRVGIIICGTNIDRKTHAALLRDDEA
jgi:threonine dehydratase